MFIEYKVFFVSEIIGFEVYSNNINNNNNNNNTTATIALYSCLAHRVKYLKAFL